MARPYEKKRAYELSRRADKLMSKLRLGTQQISEIDESIIDRINGQLDSGAELILSDIDIRDVGPDLGKDVYATLLDLGISDVEIALRVHKANSYGAGDVPTSLLDAAKRCDQLVRKGMKVELNPAKQTPQAMALVGALQVRADSLQLASRCSRRLRVLSERVARAKSGLYMSRGSFGWMFAPRSEKEEAREAYELLRDTVEGEEGRRAQRLIDEVDQRFYTSFSAAWEEFSENPGPYQALALELVPDCLGSKRWTCGTKAFRGVRSDIDQLVNQLRSVAPRTARADKSIARAVDELRALAVMEVISDVPLEELRRTTKGLKITPLQNRGYKTIADVYIADAIQLSWIKGVSEPMAHAIKDEVQEYVDQVSTGVRIRLSLDDKSPEATKLISMLYRQRRREALCSQAKELGDRIRSMASGPLADTEVARTGESWLSATDGQIATAMESLSALKEVIHGDAADEAREILTTLQGLDGGYIDTDVAWGDFAADPVAYSNLLEKIVPGAFGGDGVYGLPEDLAREIQDQEFFPQGLLCTLRGYQEWGVKYALHQKRVLLGDEMGLGKTVQAIATMVSLRNVGETHFAVVCPASVLENWCAEVRKHSRLRVTRIHGAGRDKALDVWRRMGGVAVTTYETTARLKLDDDFEFGLCVVDEAHYIKNPRTARTVNTLALCGHAHRLLFMTGTALENKVDEMLSLIRDLQPDVARRAEQMAFMSGAQQFRDEVAPVYYRRKRDDVLTELPELIESEEWCTLGAAEKHAYARSVLSRNFMHSRRVSWDVDDISDSSKARRLREIASDVQDDNRKLLVFTYFLETARVVSDMFGEKCVGVINGSMPPATRQQTIEAFDAAPAGSVLVAQIQSGGTGLNIQSASVVVICEPQYKPSIENQAISRAYRMGQTRNVLVYRLLCKDTVDEKITETLKEKQRIFDAFADKSSAAAAAAQEDIQIKGVATGEMIQQEIERIKIEEPELAAKVEAELAAEV